MSDAEHDFLEAVDISGQINANFYTQMESKKWSDRKEALEIVDKATSVPKIHNSDFSELVRVLKKTIAKDSNIVVATLAAKCLCQLAQGLRSNFGPYAQACLPVLFEKFKEKKPNVVSTLRDAADAVFLGTNLEIAMDDIIAFLENKNPQIKSELSLFLSRVYSHHPAQVMNKKTLRPLTNALIKTLSDMDATVRDSAAMAIGTAMKVAGEKVMMTLIADVEPIKVTKIKEFCEKAEIVQPQVNGMSTRTDLTNGQQVTNQIAQTNGIIEEAGEDDSEDRLYEMLEAVDISGQINANFYTQMESKKWSDRKEALEVVDKATTVPKIHNSDFSELVRVLKKTIAKDSNIVVATLAAKCLCQLAQGLRANFGPYALACLPVLFEKFKEKKPNVISTLREASDAAFMGANLESSMEDITAFLDNKNPQIKSEMALFLSRAFANYPAQVLNRKTLRPLINALIKTLSDMDATVRDNSAMAIGTAMKVTGEKLMMTLIADVEPIKIPKIKEFCEKAQVKKIPQSQMVAINAANSGGPSQASQATASSNHFPPTKSSATMVRSTGNKRVVGSKLATTKPGVSTAGVHPNSASSTSSSTATVKRTATIIKRSTVNKGRTSLGGMHAPPAPPGPPGPQQQALAAQLVKVPASLLNNQPMLNNSLAENNHIGPHQFIPPNHPLQQQLTSTPAKPSFSSSSGFGGVNNATFRPPSKQDQLDALLVKLISSDSAEVQHSVRELDKMLAVEQELAFKNRVSQLIDLACLQLVKSSDIFNRTSMPSSPQTTNNNLNKDSNNLNNNNDKNATITLTTNNNENNNSSSIMQCQDYANIESILQFLNKLFSHQQLVSSASQQTLRFLMRQLFLLVQGCLNRQNADDTHVKSLNNLVFVIMDAYEPSNRLRILTSLLEDPSPTSIVEPIKQAIIHTMRSYR